MKAISHVSHITTHPFPKKIAIFKEKFSKIFKYKFLFVRFNCTKLSRLSLSTHKHTNLIHMQEHQKAVFQYYFKQKYCKNNCFTCSAEKH